ncbi:hypothetical protein DFS34DRAFT_596337 [Phlyctochytrium arcticum]|nr:hypothetical protein DFS34DRAFT_596337 [Phlyctochytrium arcticum]
MEEPTVFAVALDLGALTLIPDIEKANVPPPGIWSLPPEIIFQLSRYLTFTDKAKTRLVSRQFEDLFWTPSAWNVFDGLVATNPHEKNKSADLTQKLMHRVLASCSKSVRSFRIQNLQQDSLSHLAMCANLSELVLHHMEGEILLKSMRELSLSGAFIQLRKLDITMDDYCYPIFTSDAVDYMLALIGTSCVRLEELHFITNSSLTRKGIQSLVSGCHHLEVLSLSSCHVIADEDLEFLVAAPCASYLRYLCLLQAPNVTDIGLAVLACHLPGLETFLIHHNNSITDAGVGELAARCKRLQWIKLVGCQNVTLGVLDDHNFEGILDCPIVHDPIWPVGLGFAYRRMTK